MSEHAPNANGLHLPGLDGANPLGFLAALGTLRALTDAWPNRNVKMAWSQIRGAWRPTLYAEGLAEAEVVSALSLYLPYCTTTPDPLVVRHHLRSARGDRALARLKKRWARRNLGKDKCKSKKLVIDKLIAESRTRWLQDTHPCLLIGKDTNLPGHAFRDHLLEIAARNRSDRMAQDQFSALGSDLADKDGKMLDTAFRTMSGAGHQHFVEFMANLLEQVTPDALRRTLLNPWDYGDPVKTLTLRFDPIDDSRYALQWRNPSKDATREQSGSMLGANALAVFGLSLHSTVPEMDGLATIGITGKGSRDTFWTWPLWSVPIDLRVTGSVLTHPALREDPLDASVLRQLGVATVYRSQRLTIGKFRNFTPARAIFA